MFNRLHDAVSATTQRIDEQLTARIQELELQLKQLREEQTHNKGRQQRQLTLVGALQSALGQVVRAVHATGQAEETELLDAFWDEIEAVKSGEYEAIDLAQLPQPSEPDEATPEPNYPTPNGNGNGVVDGSTSFRQRSRQAFDTAQDKPLTVNVEIVNGNGHSNGNGNGNGNGHSNSNSNGKTPSLEGLTLNQLKEAVLKVINRDEVYRYGPLNLRATWEKAYHDVVGKGSPKNDLKSLIQSSAGRPTQ